MNFVSNVAAKDYIYQQIPYQKQIEMAAAMIQEAEYILLGAGAGLSAAAGLTYGGQRFQNLFFEFIEKYGMTDMYSACFYPFQSEEARWGYWSKHVYENCLGVEALPLYKQLYELVKDKKYFVLTTNADRQFYKTGFDKDKIFATQGDYELIQCQKACHQKTYHDQKMIMQMHQARRHCEIPSYMVPKCPICGGPMNMNLRCDYHFVEDDNWHEAEKHFQAFMNEMFHGKALLLELGVGFNTPTIIRYPFEKLMRKNKQLRFIRLNASEAFVPASFQERVVGIQEDITKSIVDIAAYIDGNKERGECKDDKKTDEIY